MRINMNTTIVALFVDFPCGIVSNKERLNLNLPDRMSLTFAGVMNALKHGNGITPVSVYQQPYWDFIYLLAVSKLHFFFFLTECLVVTYALLFSGFWCRFKAIHFILCHRSDQVIYACL